MNQVMINTTKEVEIEYEVRYDIVSTIKYKGEENPGEYYFSISRHYTELTFDDECDEAKAIINSAGEVEVEAYDGGYLRDEEVTAISNMLQEIIKTDKI
jgi:hypothetical protein